MVMVGELRLDASAALQFTVEAIEYECRDQTPGDFFSSRTMDLTHRLSWKGAVSDNSTDVLLHIRLGVEQHSTPISRTTVTGWMTSSPTEIVKVSRRKLVWI